MKRHEVDVWNFKEGPVAVCSCGWSRGFLWEEDDRSWAEAHRHYDVWRPIAPVRLMVGAGGDERWTGGRR